MGDRGHRPRDASNKYEYGDLDGREGIRGDGGYVSSHHDPLQGQRQTDLSVFEPPTTNDRWILHEKSKKWPCMIMGHMRGPP